MGSDKVLLFVRSIDHAVRETMGIELDEDDRANDLTEDESKVGRIWQRLDEEWSARAKGKMRDGAPSQQEQGAHQKGSRKLNIGARIEEAYAALKVMVEEEEKSRPRTEAGDMGLIDIPE